MSRAAQYTSELRRFQESVKRAHGLVARVSDDDKLRLKQHHDAIRSAMLALEQGLGIK